MTRRFPERLTPLANRLGLQPLYGDIHNHCALSYGHGRLEDALSRAALQLDFVSITGHAAWPDMPVDVPEVAHIVDFHVKGFAKLKANWKDHFAVLKAFESPGRFAVFPGYEIHSSEHGDYTIVYGDLDVAEPELADSPAELKQALQTTKGENALAFPHHIGYRQGARGINWDTFDPELSPFVEMFSMHGCAEESESERSYLHSMGPVNGASTMRAGLKRGAVFGVVGNTDHHSAFPGSYGHGRMAVYAADDSRDAIFKAMRARRTNALTGDNIHLLTAIGDVVQGGITAPSPDAALDIEAIGGGFIDSIDIVRNGELFERISPELSPAPIEAESEAETILFVELGWGARGRSHDWAGELHLEGGEILGLEPRFRGAEIVSPLEGEDETAKLPTLGREGGNVQFSVTAAANPNNVTSATQGFAIRLKAKPGARLKATLSGKQLDIALDQLFEGALSGNLGPIDSPAFRFHALPRPHQWQWHGTVALGALADGENIYVRLREKTGQMAWTSPIFCRREA
ncbi:hypothetical protein K7H91_00880 [Martelella mediterranea]|uniref:hypothetical protein n=1 Tax=Martelella mediterranea TaxID=293089 RepID=UPI001E39CE38|nr:hypothetical protein [Martelella mediterranea]MCD1632303.1 hypothetical protein [Martelella mediterranea]